MMKAIEDRKKKKEKAITGIFKIFRIFSKRHCEDERTK
jgi:hypothetical protein